MRRPGNILLIAIIIGAVAAAWVYRYLRAQQAAVEEARRTPVEELTDVIVANETIPIGTRITAPQVKAVSWPIKAQPDGAAHVPDDVVGRVARITIEKNQPLLTSVLLSEQAGLLPLLINAGMRGVSVRVDSVTGVSGFITPNSRVDVLVSGNSSGRKGEHSKIMLQNVKVLATGKTIEQRDEKPVEVPTVTLLVSPADAEKLALVTRVQLALRAYQDEDLVMTPGFSLAALFGEDEEPQPRRSGSASAELEQFYEAPPPSIEVVLGDQVTHQTF